MSSYLKSLGNLSQSKIDLISLYAKKLGIKSEWLYFVIFFETKGTFNPAITNGIGATGLIQFVEDYRGAGFKTIGNKRYTMSSIRQMSFEEQIVLVYNYYKYNFLAIKKIPTNFLDTYLVTFFPAAIGKPKNYKIETNKISASKIASQNPVFNIIKDGAIYKHEIDLFFKNYFNLKKIDYNKVQKKSIFSIFS